MVVHHVAEGVLQCMDNYFKFKPGSVGEPAIYLGANMQNTRLETGVWEWANSTAGYIKESVANVQTYLAGLDDKRFKMTRREGNPFVMNYERDLNKATVLEPDLYSWYQLLIGRLRWMVEIGKFYICTPSTILLPTQGSYGLTTNPISSK